MTGKELAEKALDIAKNRNTVYMWGVFGAPVTEALIAGKVKQYPSWYTAERQAAFRKLIGKNYFGFDCVNLMKGLVWGWNADNSKTYGGASYQTNGCPDYNADQMIQYCKGVSTVFKDIPVGAALWVSGHFGIYIGDGLAVEATPRWKNNVQITCVENFGKKAGHNCRKWDKWGLLPFINYETPAAQPTPKPVPEAKPTTFAIGDVVNFTGTKHYSNANAATPATCKPGKAKVTKIAAGTKYPYHLVRTTDGGSTVYGWVDVADIQRAASQSFKVQVTATELNIRKGPGTNNSIAGSIKDKGVYEIVEVNGDWGKLSSGAGWIHLGYTKKI
jgi:hypothetical protein